jgi:hypothetical protein
VQCCSRINHRGSYAPNSYGLRRFDLFPGYVLAEDARHTSQVLVCASCGDLNEVIDPARPGTRQ